MVSDSPDCQPYVVHEAWKAIRDTENCTEKQPLTQVSCWCIGEYGASLLDGVSVEGETLTVSEDQVIDVYQKILWAKHMSLITKQYALMSVTKLSTRFPNATPKIQDIIDAFSVHMEIDLQQRGVEFSQLFRGQHSGMRSALLEPMPPMEREVNNAQVNGGNDNDQSESLLGNGAGISIIGLNENNAAGAGGDSLLDLIDNAIPSSSSMSAPSNPKAGQDSLLDLLGDLDLSGSSTIPPVAATNSIDSVAAAPNSLLDGLIMSGTSTPQANDLFNNLNGSSSSSLPSSSIPKLVGYNKNDISITFHFDRPTPAGLVVMNLEIANKGPASVTDFYLQAAVPKSMQLEILAANATQIESNGGVIQQVLKVNNPNKAMLKMRLKVSFQRSGQQFLDQGEVANFPPELTMSN